MQRRRETLAIWIKSKLWIAVIPINWTVVEKLIVSGGLKRQCLWAEGL
jgi:hypothetical protein